ncbi:ABC transporter ATP-binding protein [Lapidilactobacillus bayanensis]|uniref:ABC transporter ATP-binding protein n=1 Tax=Lapidilactobacillus bayanensis TaxID=2485998 RepID=UPI000F7B51EE|nr:ABC transporter ATP-binding protein [Lapidilactobacillus bayanensis]
MKSTFKLLTNHKGLTALSFMFIIAMAISSVASSLTLAPLTDSLVTHDVNALIHWLLLTIMFWVITLSLNYVNSLLQAQIVRKVANELRMKIAEGLNGISIPDYQKVDHNEYVSWLTNDVNLIETNGLQTMFDLIGSSAVLILSAGALFFYHYSLALVTILLAAVTMVVPNLFGKFMERETTRISKANSRLLAQIEDTIAGFSVFFSHNIGSALTKRIAMASDEQGAQQVTYTRRTGLIELLMGLLSVFAQMATTALTSFLVLGGYFSIGVISSSGQISGIVFSNLSKVISDIFKIQSVSAILKKDIKPDRSIDTTTPQVGDFDTALTLDHLSYGYTTDKSVIKDLSYRFEKGGKYAIVGKSGVGKSTLINLISGRINDYGGSIKIDDQELQSLSTPSLNSKIELVEQKSYIFNESVEENITLGVQKAKSLLNSAVSFLGIDKFTTTETLLSEHGQNLSGGQRQKLALARALTFDKPILIIDEVTAGIDAESAQQIEDTLLADKDRTVIMITHTLTDKTRSQLTDVVEL